MPPLTIAAGAILYLLMPGPTQSLLGSWPLSPAGVVTLVAAAGLAWLARRGPARGGIQTGWMLLLFVLIAARALLSVTEAPSGWLASYYANDQWSGRPEWSSDFRFEDATRIDRSLSFTATGFPAHYLNGAAFDRGFRREVTEPMSVKWSGAFDAPAETDVLFDARVAGKTSLLVDGSTVFEGESGAGRHRVSAGRHTVTATYVKAANADGAFHLSFNWPDGHAIAVVPTPVSGPQSPVTRLIALILDIMVIALLVAAAIPVFSQVLSGSHRIPVIVGTSLAVILGAQGFITARPWLDRMQTLGGGDDWLGFESRARDVLQHGVLMTLGKPLGEGTAYFYHPFYSYVLAAAHAIGGESLFAPIFMHFLVLAATAFLMWSFARGIFGELPAACALAALLVIFELDFIRYYTITLLSENIYVLTVTLCLRAFAQWAQDESPGKLIQAGLWAGVSAVTRPAMMMFFVPAMFVAFVIAARPPSPRLRRAGRTTVARGLAAAAMIAVSWLVVIAPFTIRNWIVSRKLVLISDSLGGGFIIHNTPPGFDPAAYLTGFSGGVVASIGVLWRILIEHPSEFLSLQIRKLGFTLGMVHWYTDYRPHPELVAISALYLVMLVLSPMLRRAALWPVHAFVLAHVASMGMTAPWNYGYRLILPGFVYTTTFSVAAAAAWLLKRQARVHERLTA